MVNESTAPDYLSAMDDGSTDFFDVEREFFVIDSENLNSVETKLYGYFAQSGGIFENDNLTSDAVKNMDGCGSYVYVESCRGGSIEIHQDYNGSYGLYLYQNDNYFAISNSFFRLLDHLKYRVPLSINRDYANHFLVMALASLSYSETAVNEIKLLDKDAVVTIDKQTAELKTELVDYGDNTLSLDSEEGIATLDRWFEKWTTIFRNIKAHTNQMSVNLSGGFDSRVTFMLMLESGINLSEVEVRSIHDELHTHKEDYEIASEIAEYYGFKLNNTPLCGDGVKYSLKDIVNMEFYTKMTFHKEMYYKHCKLTRKRYNVPGSGGESVRAHWDISAEDFIDDMTRRSFIFSYPIAKQLCSSTEKVLRSGYNAIYERFHIEDRNSKQYPLHMHHNIRCRSHFGKATIESVFANIYTLTPLIDPDLLKLKLSVPECQDNNLLMALMYARYCPKLLEFRFEGGRSIDKRTIEYARKINDSFPPYDKQSAVQAANDAFVISTEDQEVLDIIRNGRNNQEVAADLPDKYLKAVFDSHQFKNTFTSCFDEELYIHANDHVKKSNYHPLRECYGIIGLTEVIEDVSLSNQKKPSTLIQDMNRYLQDEYRPAERAVLTEQMKNSITARIDIKLCGEAASFELVEVSDGGAVVTSPAWMQFGGVGNCVEAFTGEINLVLRANTDGRLDIALRSKDVRDSSGNRIPYWIDYVSFAYNDAVDFDTARSAWHDKPIKLSHEVSSGETVKLHVEWVPYQRKPEAGNSGKSAAKAASSKSGRLETKATDFCRRGMGYIYRKTHKKIKR